MLPMEFNQQQTAIIGAIVMFGVFGLFVGGKFVVQTFLTGQARQTPTTQTTQQRVLPTPSNTINR